MMQKGSVLSLILVALLLATPLFATTPAFGGKYFTEIHELRHEFLIEYSGSVIITEFVKFRNEKNESLAVPEFVLKYPGEYHDRIVDYQISKNYTFSKEVLGDYMAVRVTPKITITVSPNKSEVVRVSLRLTKLISLNETTRELTFLGTLLPSASLRIREAESVVRTYAGSTIRYLPEYAKAFVGEYEEYRYTYKEPEPILITKTLVYDPIYSIDASFLFIRTERRVTFGFGGDVKVLERIHIDNQGTGNISSLRLSPLVPIKEVMLVLPLEQRSLASVGPDGKVKLPFVLSGGGRRTIDVIYSVPRDVLKAHWFSLILELPLGPPVIGVVEEHTVVVEAVGGACNFTLRRLSNVSDWFEEKVSVSFVPAIFGAMDKFPSLSWGMFLVILLLIFLLQREELKVVELSQLAAKLAERVGERNRVTSDLVALYEKAARRAVDEKEFLRRSVELRDTIERISAEIGEIVGILTERAGKARPMISEISKSEKELKSLVADITAMYENVRTRKRRMEEVGKKLRTRLTQLDGAKKRLVKLAKALEKELAETTS